MLFCAPLQNEEQQEEKNMKGTTRQERQHVCLSVLAVQGRGLPREGEFEKAEKKKAMLGPRLSLPSH